MDEKPVQFFADFRKGFRSKKDGVQYEDYQYIRNGTASIFLFTYKRGVCDITVFMPPIFAVAT